MIVIFVVSEAVAISEKSRLRTELSNENQKT
jgi:hypothetical protein